MSTLGNEPLLLVHDENPGSTEDTPCLVLNYTNLSTILGSIGNRPISIISVVGPQKTGKSLIFGYIVKYLTAAEKDDPEWIDWNDKNKPLDELQWSGAKKVSPEMPGIWCFNRPFILQVGDDYDEASKKEVAVILLYTQTTDKGKWTDGKNGATTSALVGLSILASSSTIFNVTKQIDEKCLSAVSSCIGSAMTGISSPGKRLQPLIPFQNATFAVRDWNFHTEFPYGMSGGRDYVRSEKLREKLAQSRDSRVNRQVTTSVFENVSACLLPYPGDNAIKTSFKGSIGELDTLFIETLKDLIGDVIDLNKVVLKKGEDKGTMSGEEWRDLLSTYINAVNGGGGEMKGEKLLKFLGLKRTVIPGEQKQYVKLALKVYGDAWKKGGGKDKKSGKERDPNEVHRQAKKKALKAFKKLVGSVEEDEDEEDEQKVDKKVEKLLKEKLEEKYAEIKAIKEKKEDEWVEKCKVDITEQYNETMAKAFPLDGNNQVSENVVKMESQNTIEMSKVNFLDKVGAKRSQNLRDLENRLEEMERKFLEKLFKKREAETEEKGDFGGGVGESSSFFDFERKNVKKYDYNTKLNEAFTGNPTRLSKGERDDGNIPLIDEWGRIERKIEKEPERYDDRPLKKNREQEKMEEERLKGEAKKVIKNLKVNHIENLTKALESGREEDLEEIHNQQMKKLLVQFEKEIRTFSSKTQDFNLYKSILEDDLQSALDMVKSKNRQLSRSKMQNLGKAMKEACVNFERKMGNFLEQNGERWDQDEWEEVSRKGMNREFEILIERFGKPDVEKVKKEVVKEMGQIKDRLKERCERDRTVTVQHSKRLITDLRGKYAEAMKKNMKGIQNEKDLLREHNQVKKTILESFRKESPLREQKKLVTEQIKLLEQGLEENLAELKNRFKMQLEGEAGTQRIAIQKALLFYNEEMEIHFKNNDFILEANLLKIHNKVCEDAKKKCSKADKFQTQILKVKLEEAFVKYQEENQMNLDVEPAIGIDLGTTFSCVSVYQKGAIKIIPNSVGKYTTPSYVLFQASGEEIVGVAAKERAYENPEGTIFDAKRILGRKFDDEKLKEDMKLWPFTVVDGGRGIPMIQVAGKRFNPEMIAAKILEQLKKDSESYLKRPVTKAVITVPAYFTDGQKQATMDAGTMAGLEVLSILTEPVAAAMAYKLQYSHGNSDGSLGDRHILIFDLGGGTFDVAVLKTSKGHIEVLTVDGDTHLGGEDFDRNMMNYCAEEFKKKHKVDLFEGKDSAAKSVRDDVRRRLKRLQGECERQKIALASARSADVRIDRIYKEMDLEVTVSRAMFEEINGKLFDTTIKVVEKALNEAKLRKEQIDDIVMVGGSTRIPKIQKMLRDFFDGKELDKKINPDEAVAHGAGLMAAIKKGNVSKGEAAFTKIQDVTPMPIGVEIYGGGFSAIIPKSTKIPVKLEERYKTAHNNQTSVQITIYEGEDPVAVKNKHLGDFYLNGIPPKGAGEENIDVEMVINEQGILHVTAKCSSTGTKNAVTVTENKQRMGQQAIKRYIAEKGKAA